MYWYKMGNVWINMEQVQSIAFRGTDEGEGANIAFSAGSEVNSDAIWVEPGLDVKNLKDWLRRRASDLQ